MGAFSGLITFAVAYWYLQTVSDLNETAADEDKKNGWRWFWIGGGAYFGGYLLGHFLNYALFAGTTDVAVGDAFLGEASAGDTGFLGIMQELMPLFLGVAAAYVVRKQWLLNEKFDFSALMSRFSALMSRFSAKK